MFSERTTAIYQCLDGAIVLDSEDGKVETSTIDEALSKFKHVPVIKLKDMELEMVDVFMKHGVGQEILAGIRPHCFDRANPPSHSLTELVAMAACLLLKQLESFRSKDTASFFNSLDKLIYQIALGRVTGRIFPYE